MDEKCVVAQEQEACGRFFLKVKSREGTPGVEQALQALNIAEKVDQVGVGEGGAGGDAR